MKYVPLVPAITTTVQVTLNMITLRSTFHVARATSQQNGNTTAARVPFVRITGIPCTLMWRRLRSISTLKQTSEWTTQNFK